MLIGALGHHLRYFNGLTTGEKGNEPLTKIIEMLNRGFEMLPTGELWQVKSLGGALEHGGQQRRVVGEVGVNCHLRNSRPLRDRSHRRRHDAAFEKEGARPAQYAPFRGVGANTALWDAAVLHKALVAVDNGEKDLLKALAAYERAMIDHGFRAVRTSQRDMARFHAKNRIEREL